MENRVGLLLRQQLNELDESNFDSSLLEAQRALLLQSKYIYIFDPFDFDFLLNFFKFY